MPLDTGSQLLGWECYSASCTPTYSYTGTSGTCGTCGTCGTFLDECYSASCTPTFPVQDDRYRPDPVCRNLTLS